MELNKYWGSIIENVSRMLYLMTQKRKVNGGEDYCDQTLLTLINNNYFEKEEISFFRKREKEKTKTNEFFPLKVAGFILSSSSSLLQRLLTISSFSFWSVGQTANWYMGGSEQRSYLISFVSFQTSLGMRMKNMPGFRGCIYLQNQIKIFFQNLLSSDQTWSYWILRDKLNFD